MSTKPYEAAIASTRAVLEGISADQMSLPSPCASWNVGELVNHVIGAQAFFAAGVTGTPPAEAGDPASGDFLAAFDEAAGHCLNALSAEGAMEQVFKLPFGEMPGAAVAGLAATDTFQHGWDLAKATGQSTDLAPELAAGLLAQSKKSISDGFRGDEGAAPFGAEQQAPDGATTADQLAAFLGRSV